MTDARMEGDELERGGLAALAVRTDRELGRAGVRSTRYLRIALQAMTLPSRTERRPVQVAFALDRSGSMGTAKMALARQAVIAAVRRLQPSDRFAVTVFDDRVDVVQPAGPATPEAVEHARLALERIEARGSTALHEGWDLACQELLRPAAERPEGLNTVARCLLVTDGQANHGISEPQALGELARHRRALGVATTTLGIGQDFHEALLATMSRAGGGQFYYVQHAGQLQGILQSEVGEAMEVVARGLVVELWPSPGVRLELLSDYPATWTGTHLRVEVGDLVSAQRLDLLVSAKLPAGKPGDGPSVEVRAGDGEGPLELPVCLQTWRLDHHRANDVQPRDFEVLRPVAEVIAAQAQLRTLDFNRQGDFLRIQRHFDEAIERIRWLGEHDPEIARQIQALQEARRVLSQRVDEAELKLRHMHGTQVSRSKNLDGTSRRS